MQSRTCVRGSVRERLDHYSMAEPNSGCWLWTGDVDKNGYGKLTVTYRSCRAHRLAYQEFAGPIPDGMQVLHKCDTPSCVNPAHLFLGTNADNMADRDRKGRHVPLPGHLNGQAKLSEAQVIAIRAMKGSHRQVAAAFEISPSCVGLIRTNARWKHVSDR